MKRSTLAPLILAALLPAFNAGKELQIQKTGTGVEVRDKKGGELLRYWTAKPENSTLSVEGGCFFHPLTTPSGISVTEVGPADHPHHRGIFLAWVEMHGSKDADFWGWGEHAPKDGRKILNKKVSGFRARGKNAAFTAENAWIADGATMLVERVQAAFTAATNANILDLQYRLTPSEDITLSQWAFSGFCVRTRKDGVLSAEGPGGVIDLPNPKHTEPKSDWPDAAWYAYTLKLPDGKTITVAVINHPENPPTLWHNHRDVRMLNPCIVAPATVQLKKHRPLTLRYRVVANDGAVPRDLLDQLAKDWSRIP